MLWGDRRDKTSGTTSDRYNLFVICNKHDDGICQRTIPRVLCDGHSLLFERLEYAWVLIADGQIETSTFDAARHTRAHIASADERYGSDRHEVIPYVLVLSLNLVRSYVYLCTDLSDVFLVNTCNQNSVLILTQENLSRLNAWPDRHIPR